MSAVAPDVGELLTVSEVEGKGRSLVSTRPLKAGQIILRDSPLVVYSAFPVTDNYPQNKSYCAHCFRIIKPDSILTCPKCSDSNHFCSANCLSIAQTSTHTPWVCGAYRYMRRCPSPYLRDYSDRQIQARYLIAACNIARIDPSSFQTLLSLQGENVLIIDTDNSDEDRTALFLHTLITTISPDSDFIKGIEFTQQLAAHLLAKEKLNAFGLMEPFQEDKERSVRAYGIYPRASFFNHDCLPNACRFDYLDKIEPPADAGLSTDIIVRMIHDVPESREICLSYFPVNFKYSDRQKRLKEDYGFVCECDRCKVEANWSDEESMDDDDNNDSDDNDANDDNNDEDDVMEEVEEESDDVIKEDKDFPHAYFFMRYMCNRNNCGGTLAPVSPTAHVPISSSSASSFVSSSAIIMECNVCGNHEELNEP